MRSTIIDKNCASRKTEGAGDDLESKDDGEGGPHKHGFVGKESQVWHDEVGEDGEGKKEFVAGQRAQFGVQGWVEKDLEGKSDDTNDGGGETDTVGGEA